MTKSGRRIPRAALVLLAVVTVIAGAACGSDDAPKFSATPRDYIPTSVNHRTVATKSPFAESLAKSLGGTATTTAAGSIGLPRVHHPLPDAALTAIHGDAAATKAVDERTRATFLAGTTPTASEIDGTTVTAGKFRQGTLQAAIATAAPRPDVRVIALSFDGSPANATALVRAMLAEGKT